MRRRGILLSSIAAAAMLASIQASDAAPEAAENPCKGLQTDACGANTSCSWVRPHKVKSGKEVAGFCRRKPTPQAKAAKPAAKG